MGGVVEGGVGIADRTSPRRAAIEKAHAELRQGYEIRDKTKRELEFLLEGGDPLELVRGNAASVSVQSTSFTDPHTDHFVTSEAKGSFAITASPHGDSVESSGRLETNPCEPNSADNLLLFDAEFSEGNRSSLHPSRSNIVSSEKFSHTDGNHRTGELGDSAAFGHPRKAYKRRYRSRPNRDGTRSSSTDVNPVRCSYGSSLPSLHGHRDVKGLSDVGNRIISSNSKLTSPLDDTLHKTKLTDSQQDIELDGSKAVESAKDLTEGSAVNEASDAIVCETPMNDQRNQQLLPGVLESPIQMDLDGPEAMQAMEGTTFAAIECQPGATAIEVDNKSSSCQMNGFSSKKGDIMKNDGHNNGASCGMKRLDSESSCTQTSRSISGNNDTDICTKMRSTSSNGQMKDQTPEPDKIPIPEGDESVKETGGTDSSTLVDLESSFACQSHRDNGVQLQPEEELNQGGSALEIEAKDQFVIEGVEACRHTGSESGRKSAYPSVDKSGPDNENSYTVRHQDSTDVPIPDLPRGGSLMKASTVCPEAQTSPGSDPKLARKIDEDSILKEAQIIEAKRKRIAELSFAPSPKQILLRSHWDYVLEEMAWLANDFAQERVWKTASAAQKSSRAAFTCCLRKQANSFHLESKKVANTLAKSVMEFWQSVEETSKSKVLDRKSQRDNRHSVQAYAVRFRRYNNYNIVYNQAEVPLTPERVSDMGILGPSWEDNLTEENLFYTVLPGTMETYRSSIESHVAHCQGAENKVVHQSALLVKRPGGNLIVSIPTKRVRTASRRVVSPLSAGTSGFLQIPSKTDASSGDTNSFLDDQSTLRGGSHAPYSLDVESVAKFEKQLPIESEEVSTKHKKKKKAKHMNAAYERRWQVDSTFQNEQFQRDQLRKSHQFELNCSSGLLGQPMAKKPKIMRQSKDSTFENIKSIGRSVPSPVASQMSNMSNPNKFIKMLGGRDRGRKPKGLKMPAGQPGSGTPWTLFEDQALVVLAHDLGPNWELISDAINSTLQFKCMFRKSKECKERHNFLMDRTSGDGADSAEDSGSSQPYPSTLPGIPKGSARQLFQCLQGPMEEDTLKSHFEKIIIIGQKQIYRKTQDPKQLQQPHNSHTIALSQVCPNNLNGGPILTPLDLCDTTIAGTDTLPLVYQGPHSGGLSIPNQGNGTLMHPASGTSSGLQGSPSVVVGNSFSSSPSSLNSSARDARSRIPRTASLSADEQQRSQQYNHMLSSRSVPESDVSAPGAHPGSDRGVRMLPGGSGMGLVTGVNRSMPMARPGCQGIASSSIANSGGMVFPGMPSVNMQPGVGSSQGSSMTRPRETLHMMRPTLVQDSQRPLMPDLQMQASPGNNHMPHFGGLSSPFRNQTSSPPVPSYALHHPPSHPISPQKPQVLSPHHHPHFPGPTPNHAPNPQQQAYGMRLTKERPQHHFLQQPQMPHSIHSQLQGPLQNNSQAQPQTGSPPVSLSPMNSIKRQTPAQGTVQKGSSEGSGLTNQSNSRQRQRQQFSQANRQHPRQQQAQSQQPLNNVAKGVGRANPVMQKNVPIDPSLVNGVSANPGQFLSPPKNYSSSTKNLHQMTSHNEKSNQGHVPAVAPPGQSGPNHRQTPSRQKLVNQNQSVLQRVSNHSNKPQTRDSVSDQNLTSSSTEMDTMKTLPQATSSSESLLESSSVLNSATNTSFLSMPSNANESAGQGHGLGQRRLSASLPSNSAQAPSSPVPQSQHHHQLSSLHSQQQMQLLQTGNKNLYSRPSDPRLE